MKQLLPITLTIAAVVGLSGCPAEVVKEGAKDIPKVTRMQCDNERDIMQKAIDAYSLLEQKPPANEAALVPNYLHALSDLFDIDSKGNVVPAPGGPCT